MRWILLSCFLVGCSVPDPVKKAAFLDEIAGIGSLALLNPYLNEVERDETRKAIDNCIADGDAHYK